MNRDVTEAKYLYPHLISEETVGKTCPGDSSPDHFECYRKATIAAIDRHHMVEPAIAIAEIYLVMRLKAIHKKLNSPVPPVELAEIAVSREKFAELKAGLSLAAVASAKRKPHARRRAAAKPLFPVHSVVISLCSLPGVI